jgi:hypothetical protein
MAPDESFTTQKELPDLAFCLLLGRRLMNYNSALVRTVQIAALSVGLGAAPFPAPGAESYVSRTNWVERTITNFIEVRMPKNVFVNEYHTNWVEQVNVNVVEVYKTNHVTRNLTNTVVVDSVRTNLLTAYQTNFVVAYQTNWKTLNLTNWQTVVLLRTNWVAQPANNLVQLNPAPARTVSAPKPIVEPKVARLDVPSSPPAVVATEELVLEASRSARSGANNQAEIQLKVRAVDEAEPAAQVQQWRVEREDGAILSFGQDQEFKRSLPVGKYKVEAKVRHEADGPLLLVRGLLTVNAAEATIQPMLVVKR